MYAVAPREQLGVRCLAQGHLVVVLKGRERAVHLLCHLQFPLARDSNSFTQFEQVYTVTFKILFKIMSIVFSCPVLVIFICKDVINFFSPHLFEQINGHQSSSTQQSSSSYSQLVSLLFCYIFCTCSGSIWEMRNNRITILLLKWLLLVCQSKCHIFRMDIYTVWTTKMSTFKIHFYLFKQTTC